MDQFTVPKFIEHKPKIVGPLTFQQFIYVGIAAGVSFFLYFTVHFFIFVVSSIILFSVGTALAFIQIGGRPLPEIIKNFFGFSFAPKLYLWKKKMGPPPKLIQEEKPKPKGIGEVTTPTIVGKSHLKNLSNKIETRGR